MTSIQQKSPLLKGAFLPSYFLSQEAFMHIPACQTNELDLMDFDRALAQALQPSPDYDISR